MEMIFHYGDLYKQYTGRGKSIIQPRCLIIGQLTKPLEIEPTGRTGIFSVRFHPYVFFPCFPTHNGFYPLYRIIGFNL
ncbi:DUF6597 domain-containing transcriptional factor [Chryseobacterium limigenitum]|uniref:DUF6597 domain-containing transcriptional factor n=2 Tax=Chryseobacterium TaxID=59732 RepID=UPI00339AA331